MSKQRVGVIGGGQLAWMMAQEAPKLDIELVVQTPSPDDPAVSLAQDVVLAPVGDAIATAELAQTCSVITFENEFVDLAALKILEEQGVCFCPSLANLSPLLDKFDQRSYLQSIGLPVPQFELFNPDKPHTFSFPFVLKARRYGYDGQGTYVIKNAEELDVLAPRLNAQDWLIEEFIPFERELAIMAARGVNGEVVLYPVVETQQVNQVCHSVIVPAPITTELKEEIDHYARLLLNELQVVGIFGIELFLTATGQILVNEIAPRTHNSGHYTLDACDVSQFAMQLQAVTGKALKQPTLTCQQAVMVNLLGYENARNDYTNKRAQLAAIPHAFVHWYNKTESRLGRKLGHVTVLVESKEKSEGRVLDYRTSIIKKIETIWYGS